MKTLDDAVIELNGVWPSAIDYMTKFEGKNDWRCARSPENGFYICTRDQFQQRAKELGFVGKYRWGVEYATNGKKPDLADDVQVTLTLNSFNINHVAAGDANWSGGMKFKITDQRYKPADTSYLDKPDSSIDNGNNYNEGAEHFEWIANQFDNVDDVNAVWALRDKLFHSRKAEAEKKRVVDAAIDCCDKDEYEGLADLFSELYDAGYLRLPANKD
jgi:hypothetical protein